MKKVIAVFLLLSVTIFAGASRAAVPQGYLDAVREADSAVGRYAGDYALIDQDGVGFRLKELAGKPVVVSFITTGCKDACPVIIMNLDSAFRKAGADFGDKFTSLTIGFDPQADTPESMKSFGTHVTGDFTKWRFATADRKTVEAVARGLGFYFKKAGDGYAHLNMVTVIDKDGMVYKQVYGDNLKPEDILPHVYLSMEGRRKPDIAPKSLLDRIKLLCYTYDSSTGTYRADYGFLMAVALTVAVQAVIFLLVGYLFMARRGRGIAR